MRNPFFPFSSFLPGPVEPLPISHLPPPPAVLTLSQRCWFGPEAFLWLLGLPSVPGPTGICACRTHIGAVWPSPSPGDLGEGGAAAAPTSDLQKWRPRAASPVLTEATVFHTHDTTSPGVGVESTLLNGTPALNAKPRRKRETLGREGTSPLLCSVSSWGALRPQDLLQGSLTAHANCTVPGP